jgi:hypothetical protein
MSAFRAVREKPRRNAVICLTGAAHAKLVQAWLARPGRRIKLHFVPAYCPHLDSIELLWGLLHEHVTHNRCHQTFAGFKAAILTFLREEVPRKWDIYCDQVTDIFRIIRPKDFIFGAIGLMSCFRAAEMTERMVAKIAAPARVRKPPEIFVLTFVNAG